MEVISQSDWIIDLGPEGGTRGGCVIAQGTPTEVIKNEESYTAKFLNNFLNKTGHNTIMDNISILSAKKNDAIRYNNYYHAIKRIGVLYKMEKKNLEQVIKALISAISFVLIVLSLY